MGSVLRPSPPVRGRPRDGTLDDRILEQVVALLGSRGYTSLTLDELAVRSGVAKTTILRRWPSKAAVAAAGVERLALQSAAGPGSRRFGGGPRGPPPRGPAPLLPRPGPVVAPAARGGRHHPQIP